jgi:hypothetical protein
MKLFTFGEQHRALGCLPRLATSPVSFPALTDACPLLPRSRWRPTLHSRFIPRIHDQGQLGSCNAHAATAALELVRAVTNHHPVPISAGCLYGQICGGEDRGSTLAHALAALLDVGTTATTDIPDDTWHQKLWPVGWRDTARRFRITEVFDCPTFDHIATACLHAWPVDIGIPVCANFAPDAQGVIPAPTGQIRGWHAMMACGLSFIGRTWHVAALNSWGPWGLDGSGLCFLPETYFSYNVADAWCVRVATFPSSDQ